jgi:alkylation response protein AidB-like acyl-CoA dehydrogenase
MTATPVELIRSVLTESETDVTAGFALADRLAVDADADAPLTTLLSAAALAGAALGSVQAAAAFTRARTRPRPLPGLQRAVDDPFTQTLLGFGLIETQGAIALVLDVAERLDADDADVRALAALEVASGVALRQGEEIWEVVGTSGSASTHGFDALWHEARRRSARDPRQPRRREIGLAHLATAAA